MKAKLIKFSAWTLLASCFYFVEIDFTLPLIAIGIYYATPDGSNRHVNLMLSCLLIFIFSYEQYILANGVYDVPLHDVIMFSAYGIASILFYSFGGRIQLILALSGAIIHIGYGMAWMWTAYPHDFYYRPAFVVLTIIQLLAASKGALWSILYNKLQAVAHERIGMGSANVAGGNNAHRKHS